MPFIVSKASQDVCFCVWNRPKNGILKAGRKILIKGGAGVLDKKTLETPNGDVTEVSKEELEFLKSNSSFKRMCERGFMMVETNKTTAEKKAEKKDKKDRGAQLTKEDFEERGQSAPVVDPVSKK